jgi:TonB-linked SusC/RagA family outer membrane protein
MNTKILIFLFLLFTSFSFSQNVEVKGIVTDQNSGIPLPGVNIIIKNTSIGTSTDFDGNFTISGVDVGSILVFSYIGYLSKEVTVIDATTLDIQLDEDLAQLDEVIVVGYGTQKKSNVVGSVVSVDLEKATATPTTNVSEMLRGRAAGVQVSLADARPGGDSNIVIRGNVSVAPNGNGPLIIVDGLPFNSLNDVSPDDIANIEVLKDASATAIYGSRASNGVILVTTKRGKAGKIFVNYHGYTTVQSLTKNFNQYTGQQYIDLKREANRNRFTGEYLRDENIFTPFELEAIDNKNFVNWEDLVLNDATIQSHSLSLTAGSEKTKVFSSINYFTQDGIIPNSGFNRGSFKLNLDQQISEKLNLKAILNYQNTTQDRETGGLNFTTITPLAKPFDENGELLKFYLGPSNTNVNPLWNQQESIDETKINLTDINLSLTYNFTPSLSYTLKTFLRNRNTNRGIYRSLEHAEGDEGVGGRAFLENGLYRQSLIENIISYTPEINDKHSLDFTAVQAFDEQRDEFTQIQKAGFANDELGFNGIATKLLSDERNVTQRRLVSFLGRLRYGYLDKYLFEVTARADGASVFAENNKWGYFPAASFAWKIHKESFLENVESINELKFRVSYGATGNQGINSLESLGIADDTPYVFDGVTVGGSTASSRLPNPNLKWETTTTFNTGLDFKLFNNLFEGTVEYYKANTTDLLLDRSIAGTTGFAVTRFNVGEIENKGFEASLTTNLIRKNDLQWSVGLTVSSNNNKVLSLTGETDNDGNPIDIQLGDGRRLSIGQSINNIWLPKYDGIFQEGDDIAGSGTPLASPGDVRVIDQDGNGQIDDRDNVFTETDPDWYGSINTTLNYKGFELFADVYFVEGATKLNTVLADGELWKGAINGIRTKYYTPEFPSTKYPRPKPDTHVHLFPFAVRDASYVRLRTLTLGYNLPEKALSSTGLNSAKVYITGTNLLTFTDFQSYGPEQNPLNGDSTVFPETRAFTLGVKLGF